MRVWFKLAAAWLAMVLPICVVLAFAPEQVRLIVAGVPVGLLATMVCEKLYERWRA